MHVHKRKAPRGENGYTGVFHLRLLSEAQDTSSKSKVWKYLSFSVDENGAVTNKKQVVCRICNRSLAYSGNTTNLFYHLQANHPEEHSEVAPKKAVEKCESTRQATVSGCFSAQQAYPHHTLYYKQCENALVEFMCQ